MAREFWSPQQIEMLRALYPDKRTSDVAKTVGRSLRAVYLMANKLGLRKSETFLASPESGRRNVVTSGLSTRFVAGHATWNKGKAFCAGGRSSETQFRKGNKPANTAPIGHERVCDGYLQRKVTDTGCRYRDYRPVHHLVWLADGREIPPGHILTFRDKNKQNITLENLELITRAENARRNTMHRYPKELVDVMRLRGIVNRQIRKNQKRKQGHEKQD